MPIKINGTNTAANPSITGSDTDTGIVYGSDQIDFSIGGASKVTIDSSGNVGIGDTSPTAELSVAATAPHIDIGQAGSTRMKIGYEGNNCFFGATSNTGMFIFKQNVDLEGHPQASGTERMRIDSSGRVGIGTTSPDDRLVLSGSTGDGLKLIDGTHTVVFRTVSGGGILKTASNHALVLGTNDTERMRIDTSGNLTFSMEAASGYPTQQIKWSNDSTTANGFYIAQHSDRNGRIWHEQGLDLVFGTNNTERMRIDSVGALNINTSTNPLPNNSAGRVHITCPNGGDGINVKHLHSGHCVNLWRANGDGTLVNFYRGDSAQGSTVGGISVNSSNTAFNTASDYRLKENATAISDGITRLKKLKPYRFNFKIEPSRTVDGFFAHEVTPAVPEAITGEKDALDSNGDIDPQSIDQSKLVPLLVAALQEAIGRIEALEAS